MGENGADSSFEKMSTPALRQMLKNDYSEAIHLSTEETLLICEILVRREIKSAKDQKDMAEATWKRFMAYCDEDL